MPSPQPIPRIEITTDGGFAGRGLGGIVIDGIAVTATDLGRSCKGTLTAGEQDGLARAIARLDSSGKHAGGHPDEIGYTLKVNDETTSWSGENPPKGVAAVFERAWKTRQRVLDSCR
jgi:hypothetical protein